MRADQAAAWAQWGKKASLEELEFFHDFARVQHPHSHVVLHLDPDDRAFLAELLLVDRRN